MTIIVSKFCEIHLDIYTTHIIIACTLCDGVLYIGWAQLMEEEMKGWAPVGVVCAIVPWNFPLMLLSWKARR